MILEQPIDTTNKICASTAQHNQTDVPFSQEIALLQRIFATGQYNDALSIAKDLTERFPLRGESWNALGAILGQMGRIEDSLSPLQTASVLLPVHADIHNNLAITYQKLDRLNSAEIHFRSALKIKPDFAEALNNLGLVLHEQGRLEEAETSFKKSLQIMTRYFEAAYNLGITLNQLGKLEESAIYYKQALIINPVYFEAYNKLGITLLKLSHIKQAEACFRKSLLINPNFTEAHCNLGFIFREIGQLIEAETSYQLALQICPALAEAHNNLGSTLQDSGQLEKATRHFRRAIQINPEYAEAHNNLGRHLKELGHLDEAESFCQRALEIQPGFADAHFNLSFIFLLSGRLLEGWQKNEFRWKGGHPKPGYPDTSLPQWFGKMHESGQNILIFLEQGFGDKLQFSRYFHLLTDIFSKVSVIVDKPLLALFRRSFPEIEILETFPTDQSFWHWHCPLLSLPLAFNTSLKTIPNKIPYLIPDPVKIDYWKTKIASLILPSSTLKVGLVWKAGNLMNIAHLKSFSFKQLAPLLNNSGITWFSLQKEPDPDRMDWISSGKLIDWTYAFNDFDDTASLIVNLDLVISVDTSVAHLAAAVGKPTWLLNRYASDWRWMLNRDDSPWYPTMRIFTQKTAGDWDEVLSRIEEAIISMHDTLKSHSPNQPSQHDLNTLQALFNAGQYTEALTLAQSLTEQFPLHGTSWNMLGVVLGQMGKFEASLEPMRNAAKLLPHLAEVHNNISLTFMHLGDLVQAETSCRKALQIRPDFAEALNNLGIILQKMARFEEAKVCYTQSLMLKPNYFEAQYNLSITLKELGQLVEAESSYRQALKLNPIHFESYNKLGNILYSLGKLNEAEICYRQAIELKPDFAEAYSNLGLILGEQYQIDEALVFCQQALKINPELPEGYNNLGNLLFKSKCFLEAEDAFYKALKLNPDFSDAYNNLGNLFKEMMRLQESERAYLRKLELEPDCADTYNNLGNLYLEAKRIPEAETAYYRALESKPGFPFVLGIYLHCRMQCCNWEDFDAIINKLLSSINEDTALSIPFLLLSIPSTLDQQKHFSEVWIKQLFNNISLLPLVNLKLTHKKICLGYFSADFHNHPVSLLIAELIETHDRTRFEVIGFSYGRNTNDTMRKRLETSFDQFIDVRNKSDREIVELSRAMEIDIAIDLGGFTAGARTGIFAMRAAPIQVSYLGYLGTMGAKYIDYLIADKTIIPLNHQNFYSEKIAYLPSYQANDRKRKISNRIFSRKELGLPETGFIFCCFNNNYKITPSTFSSWMNILKMVEGSCLFLLADNNTALINLRKEAILRGIDANRLIFGERLPVAEYLARYRSADLFLDTLPYNAGTTASDALWAGLPVLTCMGETFAGRVAASLLNSINLPELITSTQQEYEAKAIELATHPDKLNSIRQRLQINRLTTPLFNTKLFSQHIEDAYFQMWQRCQNSLPPAHIYVKDRF